MTRSSNSNSNNRFHLSLSHNKFCLHRFDHLRIFEFHRNIVCCCGLRFLLNLLFNVNCIEWSGHSGDVKCFTEIRTVKVVCFFLSATLSFRLSLQQCKRWQHITWIVEQKKNFLKYTGKGKSNDLHLVFKRTHAMPNGKQTKLLAGAKHKFHWNKKFNLTRKMCVNWDIFRNRSIEPLKICYMNAIAIIHREEILFSSSSNNVNAKMR